MKNIKGIKGFKVFNSNWTCRNFQYKVGKTYKYYGDIGVCRAGFHFCKKASDCFNYYSFDSRNKVAEIIAIGNVETEKDKSVTDEITIVREIQWQELLTIINEGKDNTGRCNTGDYNTGDYNTGNWNVGDHNVGDYNTGRWNIGDHNIGNWNSGSCNVGGHNIGNWNTGSCNTGNRNTGDYNTGNWNTGDWNTINYSTGLFNTEQKTIDIFDKPSEWTLDDWFNSKVRSILNWNFELTVWIYKENMTDEEKQQHPEYKTNGGYLKKFEFKEACKNMWNNLTEEERHIVVTELPNFDYYKFKLITGIDVNEK